MKGLQSKCCDQTLGLLRDDNHPRGSSGTRHLESKQLIQLSIQIENAFIKRGRRGQTSPEEERGNETGKVAITHGSVEFCEATPIGLADES